MADSKYSFVYEHCGMLQTDRPAQAPSADAMQVSGRRFLDLVKRTAKFAESVSFYGDDNRVHGNWSAFFSQIYDAENSRVRTEVIEDMVRTSSVPPHLALLFAFYKILLVEQADLNKLTDRHLEFYFREILAFDTAHVSEGSVTVFADLAKNIPSISIPKGLLFDAGKDPEGQAITYESVDELKLGRENVALFARYDDFFGFDAVREGSEDDTRHALCVASQLFGLAGSALKIRIGEDKSQRLLRGIQVEYTSAAGWTQAGKYDETDGFTVGKDDPPMIPYNPTVHGRGMNTEYPVVRLVSDIGFGKLSGIVPEQLRKVTVVLTDGQPLRLENKYGQVENLPGVNPFGIESHRGDSFSVILPYPSDKFELSVELNDESVFEMTPKSKARTGLTDRESYEITTDDCDQEHLSKVFSQNILTIMKAENVAEGDIRSAMEGRLMAVFPRLVTPVIIRTAEFCDDTSVVFFFHPCGVREVTTLPFIHEGFRFVRPVKEDGTPSDDFFPLSALYIAFSNADLDRGQLSLHIRVNRWVKDPGRMRWYYLRGNKWHKFSESKVLRDSTEGLIQDGTIVLDYQSAPQKGGDGLMEEFTWIKGECSNLNCKGVTHVRSHAIELIYSPASKGSGPGGASLPAATISKVVTSVPGLKKVTQPYDGLTGKKAEDPAVFRRRVAETLRHKGRAWTVWDYESLVLEAFPEVSYAKCLPSCDMDGKPCPGVVTVVVIPSVCENPLEPSPNVRLINRVKETLKGVCTPFVEVSIAEPTYRKIKVEAALVLRKGYNDPVRYEAQVNDALLDYLQSWKGYEGGVHFREGMGVSDIISFLELLPFVDIIKSIEVTLDNEPVRMDGSIRLGSPLDVITSDEEHKIHCSTSN